MSNPRALAILALACVLQACASRAMHTTSPGDASDGTMAWQAPDLAMAREVTGDLDLLAAPDRPPDLSRDLDLAADSDPIPDTALPDAAIDTGEDSTLNGPYCGDGIISGAEECDDGPANSDSNYRGCSTRCRINRCGDGLLNGPEECDCGEGFAGNPRVPPCAVRATTWGPSYCIGCLMVPDIGP